MKTFKEFIIEADRRSPRNPGESLQDYIKRVKGISNHPDAVIADTPGAQDPRTKGKTTTVSGQDIRSPGTPPRSSTPPTQPSGPPPRSSTPPPGTRPKTGSTLTIRPPNSTALTAPSTPTVRPKGIPWGRLLGPVGAAFDTAAEFQAQKERGRSTPSALAMGLTKGLTGWGGSALGTSAGAPVGGFLGSAIGPEGTVAGAAAGGVLGGLGGYVAGSELGGSAAETVAGATPKEKLAMAQANRRRQSGSLIKGVGGPTTVSQKKPGGPAFISTGAGSQRRTTQLPTTSLFKKDGKQTTGYLAFKGGKPVYKQGPNPQTLARTSSNPLERVGRTLFAGAYKQHDIKKGKEAYKTALRNTQQYQKNLGITPQKAKALGLPGR